MLASGFVVLAAMAAATPLPAPSFTGEQLDAFASMVGESRDIVAQRLYLDPGLAGLAVEAADLRAYRLRSGKRMGILGFTGFGLGTAVAVLAAVLWSNDHSVCNDNDQSGCNFQGLLYLDVIVLGGLGAVASGIVGWLGMRRLRNPWQAEREALARYRSERPSRPLAAPAASLGFTLSVPLLSGSF